MAFQKPAMKGDIVVCAEKLGKCFKMYQNPWHRAFEWAYFGKRTYHQPFWALQDISFEIRRGEFIGIIGLNGAGKSTLLKILTGILQPTIGTYCVNGRMLSLFGLNAEFNLELSGRENVFRSIELLNLPAKYVQKQIDQIAEFSELGEFFDRPVKIYSTGMRNRLAFALFTFLDCDVLILDEVLATGDIFFKQKCYARLEELIAKKTTILLVTHAMNVVRQYCSTVILLDKGYELFQGNPQKGVQMYFQMNNPTGLTRTRFPIGMDELLEQPPLTRDNAFWPGDEAFTTVTESEHRKARLTRFAICDERGEPCTEFKQGDTAYFCCEFQLHQTIGVPITRIMITNQFNVLMHGKSSVQIASGVPHSVKAEEYIHLCQKMTLGLEPGPYVFGVILSTLPPDNYACLNDPAVENLDKNIVHLYRNDQVGSFTIMPYNGQKLKLPFWGICDLPGECRIQRVSTL